MILRSKSACFRPPIRRSAPSLTSVGCAGFADARPELPESPHLHAALLLPHRPACKPLPEPIAVPITYDTPSYASSAPHAPQLKRNAPYPRQWPLPAAGWRSRIAARCAGWASSACRRWRPRRLSSQLRRGWWIPAGRICW